MTSAAPSDGDPIGTAADPIDELIIQCLREPLAARDAALAGLAARHPAHAGALRARFAFLQEAGLIEGPSALAATLPERIGGFRILRRLGQGGMGVVYLAEQESLGRRVALKVIQPGAAAPPRARERFRREVQAVSLLDHPNICQVHDAGEVEGVPYLALRYVEGETLAERLAREAAAGGKATPASDPAAIDALVAIGEQLARALHAAHEKGLVHRDVKPGNVMIEAATGLPLLLDFGLARLDDEETPTLTLSGDRLGTPAYMAPEQVAGLTVDRRTDVYALGATLYEALTGHVPHQAATREALYRRILAGEITAATRHNPRMPRELAVVLATALDRDPERRYRTAGEFADDLRRVLRREPILARPPGVWLRARRWCQRNPYAATTLGVLCAGLLVAGVLVDRLTRVLTDRDVALAGRDIELLARRAFDVLGDDPGEALELAWRGVQIDRSPVTMKALRAAVQVPQVEVEIRTSGKVDTSFALWQGAASDDLTLAWWDEADLVLWIWQRGVAARVLAASAESPQLGKYPKFCLRFSPDGHRLAIAGNDVPAMIYDLDSRLLRAIPLPEGSGQEPRTWSVAWHPKRNQLAVGTGDGQLTEAAVPCSVHLYDLDGDASGQRLWPKTVRAWTVGAWPMFLQFTEDGKHLIAAPGSNKVSSRASFRGHDVHAFRVEDGDLLSHDKHRQPCMDLAVSGSRVATVGHDGQLVLWDLETDGTTVCPHPGRIYTVDVAPDAQTLVTACEDGFVRIFDWQGNELHGWSPHGSMFVETAVFHPEGMMVLVHHPRGRELRTLDGRLVAHLPRGHGTVRREYFVRRDRLVTADFNQIRLWRLWPEGLRTHVWGKGQQPVLSRSGKRLALAGFDGVVMSDWSGAEAWSKRMPPVGLVIDEEGCAYQVTDDRCLLVVGEKGPEPTPGPMLRPMFNVGCAPEGGLVAATENWGNVVVFGRQQDGHWRVHAVEPLPARPGRGALLQRRFVWLRGPGRSWRILAPTHDGLVEFWYADDRLAVEGAYLIDDVINRLAVTADEQTMALYTMDQRLHLFERDGWRWRERRPATDVGIDNVFVAFDSKDRLLLTAVEEVRVYDRDLELVDLLPNVEEGLLETCRVPDAEKVVTVATDYVTREHWLDFARVLAEARRLLELRARR